MTSSPDTGMAPGEASTGADAPVVMPPDVTYEGRHVALRPIRAQDYELLRLVELSPDLVPLWRHQGLTPSPEQWAGTLWNGVLAQFLVVGIADGRPLGLVCAYDADFRHAYAYLAAAKFEVRSHSPLFLEGVALFLQYVFTAWAFRKLYVETSELSMSQFGSGIGELLVEEGRLRHHRYFAGRYWDQHILAIYREAWYDVASRMGAFLR